MDVYSSTEALSAELNNVVSSEGARVSEWKTIIEHTIRRPFIGSGFMGVWELKRSLGSAHSQFFDVLYRTGFVGFAVYFFVLFFR